MTKADYDTVLVPAVAEALRTHDKIRLYYETGDDFAGIDAAAAWEGFKVGMEHLTRWERVAVVSDVEWIRGAVRAFRLPHSRPDQNVRAIRCRTGTAMDRRRLNVGHKQRPTPHGFLPAAA